MVGHVVKKRPWHDLELAAVHRRRDADAQRYIGVRVRLTGWMNLVEIGTIPHNFLKLFKRASSFRTPALIRRQVAGDDDRTGIRKSGGGINGISARRIRGWNRTARKPSHGGTCRNGLTEGCATG